MSAVDRDLLPENRLFKFVILSGNVPERFSISQMGQAGSQAGQVGKIESSGLGVLDRETTAKYSLVIGAVDLNTPSIQGELFISVSVPPLVLTPLLLISHHFFRPILRLPIRYVTNKRRNSTFCFL